MKTTSCTLSHQPHGLSIRPDGHLRPVLVQRTFPDRRPYLHPLRSPDGEVELTEDMPAHHAWQHGVYIGLNDINGVSFWTEGLHKSRSDGQITTEPLPQPRVVDGQVTWSTRASYRRSDGLALLMEEQHWCWRQEAGRGTYVLDLCWDLEALTDIRAGQYAYGGLFVRMPYYQGVPVALLTSAGITQQAQAEGQPAGWVAVALDPAGGGHWHGLGLIDHPDNPGHPQSWRVDGDYGFGPGRCIAGSWALAQGANCRQRYRLVAFSGRPAASDLDTEAQSFARSPACTLTSSATATLVGQS